MNNLCHKWISPCFENVTYDINHMNDNFILYFLTTFLHRVQVWAECRSTLNLGCGISINGKLLIGTAKWEDILKLHEIDKHNVLYRLTHNVMHRHLNSS